MYFDRSLTPAERSNYALRESMLRLRRELGRGPTAVSAQGANPGLVSQLVKEAALILARDTGLPHAAPTDRRGWARLFRDLGVKAIHIAERDTQVSAAAKRPGEFVNTWSIDGFVSEGCQPAELGWGTHERHFPKGGRRHAAGCGAAIYLNRPGAGTRVRTWTPNDGPFHGFLVTHNESISIADYLTAARGRRRALPADRALRLPPLRRRGAVGARARRQRLAAAARAAADDGGDHQRHRRARRAADGPRQGAFWYGSQLTIEQARELAPYNSATSLQVAAGVLGGMVWAIEQPTAGIVEADELDYRRVLEVARPYLGPVVGVYSDWTPLDHRAVLFAEDIDPADPWQFKNILVG